jgi:lysophospholipase L1-like esterase
VDAPAAIACAAANLESIIRQLRAAAPQAEIIVTGPWNISVGAFPDTDPLFIRFNEALKEPAADTRARYADLFPIFNPQGEIDAETAAICTLTLRCTDGDIHPSDAGYRVIWRRGLGGVRLRPPPRVISPSSMHTSMGAAWQPVR